mmetsp:Transcript_15756/g.40163  ORF Transcript_15756/g.40163 Transcript_15756/m.40163 type:complete len:675 (-) Transcript_15756:811-2835(-)
MRPVALAWSPVTAVGDRARAGLCAAEGGMGVGRWMARPMPCELSPSASAARARLRSWWKLRRTRVRSDPACASPRPSPRPLGESGMRASSVAMRAARSASAGASAWPQLSPRAAFAPGPSRPFGRCSASSLAASRASLTRSTWCAADAVSSGRALVGRCCQSPGESRRVAAALPDSLRVIRESVRSIESRSFSAVRLYALPGLAQSPGELRPRTEASGRIQEAWARPGLAQSPGGPRLPTWTLPAIPPELCLCLVRAEESVGVWARAGESGRAAEAAARSYSSGQESRPDSLRSLPNSPTPIALPRSPPAKVGEGTPADCARADCGCGMGEVGRAGEGEDRRTGDGEDRNAPSKPNNPGLRGGESRGGGGGAGPSWATSKEDSLSARGVEGGEGRSGEPQKLKFDESCSALLCDGDAGADRGGGGDVAPPSEAEADRGWGVSEVRRANAEGCAGEVEGRDVLHVALSRAPDPETDTGLLSFGEWSRANGGGEAANVLPRPGEPNASARSPTQPDDPTTGPWSPTPASDSAPASRAAWMRGAASSAAASVAVLTACVWVVYTDEAACAAALKARARVGDAAAAERAGLWREATAAADDLCPRLCDGLRRAGESDPARGPAGTARDAPRIAALCEGLAELWRGLSNSLELGSSREGGARGLSHSRDPGRLRGLRLG